MLRIQDVTNPASAIRTIFAQRGTIDIPSLQQRAKIPDNYNLLELYVNEGKVSEILNLLEPITDKLNQHTFSKYVRMGVEEAVMNAHVHGNRRQREKPIFLDYVIDESKAHIFIEDQGGFVDQNFIPYLINLDGANFEKDFYKFSGKTKPDERGGVGLQTIYKAFEKVIYAPGPRGGLLLELYRQRD